MKRGEILMALQIEQINTLALKINKFGEDKKTDGFLGSIGFGGRVRPFLLFSSPSPLLPFPRLPVYSSPRLPFSPLPAPAPLLLSPLPFTLPLTFYLSLTNFILLFPFFSFFFLLFTSQLSYPRFVSSPKRSACSWPSRRTPQTTRLRSAQRTNPCVRLRSSPGRTRTSTKRMRLWLVALRVTRSTQRRRGWRRRLRALRASSQTVRRRWRMWRSSLESLERRCTPMPRSLCTWKEDRKR